MNLEDYYHRAKMIEAQLPDLDQPDLPLEAELQIALVRNKLAQIIPMLHRLRSLIPQLDAHYQRVFEVMFQEGYYERSDKELGEDEQ